MKKNFSLLFITFLLFNYTFSQEINLLLKSGKFKISNTYDISIEFENNYRYFVFNNIPNDSEKEMLNKHGITLLEYVDKNIYIASFSKTFDLSIVDKLGIIAISKINSSAKIDTKIQNGKCPEWAINGEIASLKIIFYKNTDLKKASFELSKEFNFSDEDFISRTLQLNIPIAKLNDLSKYNFISNIEPIDAPGFPENHEARTLHRSNTVNVEYKSGRHYNGEGVNIMMQDDGLVEPHIDRTGRVDEQFCSGCSSSSGNSHGDHVSGTIMGAGNLDPLARGMADGSFLYVLGYSTNNYSQSVPGLHTNYNVVITSTSYSNGCNAGYTSLAQDIDEQNNIYPNLIHVFSAGNNGTSDCGYGAGSGWGNVTGGHKQAKNVIAVANLTATGGLANSSSRGPAADGRIKPDIGAKGTNVYSTYPNYTYNTITGTSMACPGIAGVMGQLYQAYKELNGGQNPPSALMKCILLNSADDIGNPGPDFKNGWGEVNAYRAVKILESTNYDNGSISQGSSNTHLISVPANTKKIKVMVYWHDKEASTSASISLVNDINIQLGDPNGNSYNPWVLDPTPSASILDQNAIRGIDNLNNMEQITIDNPTAGNYTLTVDGFSIPFGPQDYYLSYEIIDNSVELTYPIGGEGLVPGDQEYIRWDTHNSGSLSIDYSVDGGNNWINITNSANASNGYYNWIVPNLVTSQALVKVTGPNNSSQSNEEFTIVQVPSNLNVYWPCPDSINVSWNSVIGATEYEVSMLGQKYMDSIYTTSSTNIWIINQNTNVTDSWFSVKAKVNTGKGRRAYAVNAQIQNNACAGFGCTDTNAYNYSPLAIVDDGSCCFNAGCTDPTAFNYDSIACFDDNSCVPYILGCTDPNSSNFDSTANVTTVNGGLINPNSPGLGGGYFTTGIRHLIFDAYKDFNIKSTDVYSQSTGTVIFEIRDNNGNVLDDTTYSLVQGKNTIILNFNVLSGNDYQLGINSNSDYILYRNNSGLNYPYNAADAMSITGSSASTSQGYYYYYYNLELEILCSNVILGCTDSTALNYNSLANTDDGSCCFIAGCTNPMSINYDSTACFDDSSCIPMVLGCTDSLALNYNPSANTDDGSCCFVSGCMDPLAINYNLLACIDDGSCILAILGCIDTSAINYDSTANISTAFGGITDPYATGLTGTYFNGDQHLIFNSNKDIILKSVLIDSEGQNNINFEIRNNNGTIIDDTLISVVTGLQRVYLNLSIPIGNDMQLGVNTGSLANVGLYRNQSGALYPYNIGSIIDITGTSATAPGYYYFFYDIEIETPCISKSWDCNSQGLCNDPGNGQGQYSSLSACISNCVAVTWDCDGQGNCNDPGNGLGQFTTLNDCQNNCNAPSWDCDGQYNCYDPGSGQGQYTTLSSCQSNCYAPSWDCDGQGNCYDPGNGLGQYTTLNDCQNNCNIPITWDCGPSGCFDPGNGQGTYLTLSSCQLQCLPSETNFIKGIDLSIYPNPAKGIINITFNSNKLVNINIKIKNTLGQIVLNKNKNNLLGEYNSRHNLSYLD